MNINPVLIHTQPAKAKSIVKKTSTSTLSTVKTIKFPVTADQSRLLRSRKRLPKFQHVGMVQMCSDLLAQAADTYKVNPSYFKPLDYRDTYKYKTVHVSARTYDVILEAADEWVCSEREAVYRLVINLVERGL